MKKTLEEQVRSGLKAIGRKSKFHRVMTIPILAVCMFGFHLVAAIRGNTKRIAVLAMGICVFNVYSSFSFPLYISVVGESYFGNYSEQDVTLAEETQIDLEQLVLSCEEEYSYEDEALSGVDAFGSEVGEKYSATDILEANRDRIEKEDTGKEKEVQDSYEDYEFSADDWRLVLINKQNSIPKDYEVKLGNINTIKGVMQCDERIIDELLLMIRDAKQDDVVLAICSPYRDQAYQEMLFNRKINNYMGRGMSYVEAYKLAGQAVTIPGASEHQIGLALDIVTDSYQSLNEGFGNTKAGKWLAENSYQYGFILRYPKGKEDITGIEFEPWHFRYVGVEAATVIKEKEICLEEFWEDYVH